MLLLIKLVSRAGGWYLPITIDEYDVRTIDDDGGVDDDDKDGAKQGCQLDDDTKVDEDDESRPIVSPTLPNAAVRAQHELSHGVFAPWCDSCVVGRGQDDHHKTATVTDTVDKRRRISFDYFFARQSQGEPQVAILAMIDNRTQYSNCTVVEKKGAYPDVVRFCLRFLEELGLNENDKILLHSDDESSTKQLTKQLVEQVHVQASRTTTVSDSKGSNGLVERHIKTVEGQLRCHLHSLASHNLSLSSSSQAFTWFVRHVAWLLNRFHVSQKDKQTAWQRLTGETYSSPLLLFAENVFCYNKTALRGPKLASRWSSGMWLGRHSLSNGHVCFVPSEGCVRVFRTVRRVPLTDRWNQTSLDSIAVNPFRPAIAKDATKSQLHRDFSSGSHSVQESPKVPKEQPSSSGVPVKRYTPEMFWVFNTLVIQK